MAKSKKSSKINFADVGAAILGGAIAGKVANINLPMVPEKVRPALPLLIGFLLSKQSGAMKAVGTGMLVVGGIKTLNAFAPGLGIGEMNESISDYMIEGAENYALNGMEESLSGQGSYSLSGVTSDEVNSDNFG